MGVPFEIQDGIDDVFQYAWASQRPFLGDMPDHDNGRARLFGKTGQLRGTFPDLGNRSRSGCQGIGINRLNGIDDRNLRFQFVQRADDLFQLDFRLQLQVFSGQSKPFGTKRDLSARFFTADVEYVFDPCQIDECLQKQSRFADTGISADQDNAARNQPSSQYTVELADARRETRDICRIDVGKGQNRRRLCNTLSAG